MKTYVKPRISIAKIDETPLMAGSGGSNKVGFDVFGDGGTSGIINETTPKNVDDGRAFSKKNTFFDED